MHDHDFFQYITTTDIPMHYVISDQQQLNCLLKTCSDNNKENLESSVLQWRPFIARFIIANIL